MSLCDTCMAPGACCIAMRFNSDRFTLWDDTPWEEQLPNRFKSDLAQGHVVPFYPKEPVGSWTVKDGDDDEGRTYSAYIWGCKALDRQTGRCTVYENRPDLCRSYEPMMDGLCAHYGGIENGEESIL